MSAALRPSVIAACQSSVSAPLGASVCPPVLPTPPFFASKSKLPRATSKQWVGEGSSANDPDTEQGKCATSRGVSMGASAVVFACVVPHEKMYEVVTESWVLKGYTPGDTCTCSIAFLHSLNCSLSHCTCRVWW